jgi:hypothetical protein
MHGGVFGGNIIFAYSYGKEVEAERQSEALTWAEAERRRRAESHTNSLFQALIGATF